MPPLYPCLFPLTLTFLLAVVSSQARAAPATAAATKPVPPSTDHRIRLAYFVPKDRKPTPNYEQKIRVVMAIVADVYLQDLRTKNYRTDGLRFEIAKEKDDAPDNTADNAADHRDRADAAPLIHFVRGNRDAAYYNNGPRYDANEQWRRMNSEIRAKIGNPQRQVIVVFAETYDDGPAEHLWPGVIARGGYNNADGGLAVFSAHLLRDELCAISVPAQRKIFFDQTPLQGRTAWGHKPNSPRGTFAEDGIGAVAHELAHALGLPHDRRDETHDIMGNGFRNLRWNYAPQSKDRISFSEENARLLMSSRYLATDLDLSDDQPPKLEVTSLARAPGGRGQWTISINASDNKALRAMVIVDRTAGSVIAGRALAGPAQQLRETLTIKDPKGQDPRLQLIITDTGGNQTRLAYPPGGAKEE